MEALGFIYQNMPPSITIELTRVRCILQNIRAIALAIAKVTALKARHELLITVTLNLFPKIGKLMTPVIAAPYFTLLVLGPSTAHPCPKGNMSC
jgi:hypothetical protein